MSSSSKPNSFSDVSLRAQQSLDYIISGKEEKQAAERNRQMPVSQALRSEPVVRFKSSRTSTRVLFLTSDASGLQDTSWIQQHIQNVSSVFAEVHVAILSHGKKREYPTKRLGNNIWIYNISFSSTWFLSHVMYNFAESQLQFGDGFRPDVIVALDPYYAALAAETLSGQYDRPMQIHVLEDFLSSNFANSSPENKKKSKIAYRVLKNAHSVRTNSSLVKDQLQEQFPKIEDLGVLPRHYDFDALLKSKRSTAIKQKYPQYVFIMLTAGVLDQNSTVFRIMDAARSMLYSPKIALVVVGDGPMRASLEERATILGIKEQVIFEKNISYLSEYMLSADMFVSTDTTAVGDEYVIQAAAAGLPIVMARTPVRNDLFVDGESGLLCDALDTIGFSQKMNSILNTNAFRLQFGTNARTVIRDRLHTDPEMYKMAYRDSIEVVFGNVDLAPRMAENESQSGEDGPEFAPGETDQQPATA